MYEQPVAQPVSVPQSLDALKAAVRARHGHFNSRRYLSDAHRFTCKNFCKLLTIILLWLVIGMGVGCGIERIVYGKSHFSRHGHGGMMGEDHTNYWEQYPEPQFPNEPMPTEPVNPPSSMPKEPGIPIDSTTGSGPEPDWRMAPIAVASRPERLRQMVLFGALHFLVAILLWGPAAAGMFLAVFNAIRSNSKIKFRDFFRCFCCRYYCKLLGLSLVLNILRGFLYLLFVLPGVWWTLATLFAIPLHKEYPFLGVWGSIKISKMVIHRHFCQMICFLLLLALVQVAGFFCLIVGLFYTMPLAFAALCFCFDDLIGLVPAAPLAFPPEEPVTVHV